MNAQRTEGLLAFAEDHVWVHDHRQSLLADYAGKWVAVEGKQVVDSDADPKALRSRLRRPQDACVEFLSREPLEMILCSSHRGYRRNRFLIS